MSAMYTRFYGFYVLGILYQKYKVYQIYASGGYLELYCLINSVAINLLCKKQPPQNILLAICGLR